MKFRNKESGEIYDRWNDIPCDGKCWNCPASFDNNKYKTLCSDFFRRFPNEAAAALGCEVIEDDAPYSELSADHLTVTNNYQNYQGNKITLEWISVKDRLPDPKVTDKNPPTVLAVKQGMVGKIICVARWNGADWIEKGKEITVTHWMPLPEPPKEENPCSKTE